MSAHGILSLALKGSGESSFPNTVLLRRSTRGLRATDKKDDSASEEADGFVFGVEVEVGDTLVLMFE